MKKKPPVVLSVPDFKREKNPTEHADLHGPKILELMPKREWIHALKLFELSTVKGFPDDIHLFYSVMGVLLKRGLIRKFDQTETSGKTTYRRTSYFKP